METVGVGLMKKLLIFIISLVLLGCSIKGDDKMFISIYGRDKAHIANVEVNKYSITKKVFELDVSNFEGSTDIDITSGLIFVFKNNSGNQVYSGFMKSIVQDEKTGYFSFKGDDFRKIWDTEILLDFTSFDDQYDYRLNEIFDKVKRAVTREASTIFTLNITIPVDFIFTGEVARFDGTYFYANALEFLKTYLVYYNYYIISSFDETNLSIDFEFYKNTAVNSLRLEDFVFDKSTTSIKTNHTIARIKMENNLQFVKQWVYCSEAYFAAQPESNRSTELEVENADEIPINAEDLPIGYAFRGSNQVPEDTYYFWKVERSEKIWKKFGFYSDPSGETYWNDFDSSGKLIVTDLISPYIGNPELDPNDYELGVPLKMLYSGSTVYYKVIQNTKELASTIPETHYYLGLDNEIYADTITLEKQIYPVKTKYFEDEFLAKAQFNALWELVSGRYNENITIQYIPKSPIDVRDIELYTMITVYDKTGSAKVLPVSEITFTQDNYFIKLGFKKTLFTDIVKEATGTNASGTAVSRKIYKPIPVKSTSLKTKIDEFGVIE